jgi:eukaryotic-like serine/threonine-protein kinase
LVRYPWDNQSPLDETRANHYHEHAAGQTTPVGLYPKGNTAEGLRDMLGNVWEWCADWYGEYEAGSHENPTGPDAGASKVLRGGARGDPRAVRVLEP